MSELLQLARRLYERRATAMVPYKMLDAGHVEGKCNQNAGSWVRDYPGWKIVYGWLVFDFESMSDGLLRVVRFNPHSVVESHDGERSDPTPSRASMRYPFLEHEGMPEDFTRIAQGDAVSILGYDVLADAKATAAANRPLFSP